MQAAPAHAVRARDRTIDRQDETRGRRRLWRRRRRRGQLAGHVRARRAQRVCLLAPLPLVDLRLVERLLALGPAARQAALLVDELRAQRLRLVAAVDDDARRRGDRLLGLGGLGARSDDAAVPGGDGCNDLAVLGGDRAHVVEAVKGVAEAAGPKHDLDGRRFPFFVDLDEPLTEARGCPL